MENYKLVCWKDYSIPVSEKYKWMTFDEDGVYLWTIKPKFVNLFSHWANKSDINAFELADYQLEPPEKGEFSDQLYWID